MPYYKHPATGAIQFTSSIVKAAELVSQGYDKVLSTNSKKPRLFSTKPEESDKVPTPLVPKEGFLFGCDPEAVVVDKDGKPVSAAGLIPGTKAEPHKVKCGAIQVDGMAAEFNIDPAPDFATFNKNIDTVIKELKKFLPKDHDLSFIPHTRYAPEVFDNAPEEAKELGCTPDYNAWTGEVNPPPVLPEDPYLRTFSGHLHIGWTEGADLSDLQHILNCQDLVKQLDWFLGAWSLRSDPDPVRRTLYGKAGACRYKEYGVEYRVLSNFWVTNRERRLSVWNRMQTAIEMMAKIYMPDQVAVDTNDALQQSINSSSLESDIARHYAYPIKTLDTSYCRF